MGGNSVGSEIERERLCNRRLTLVRAYLRAALFSGSAVSSLSLSAFPAQAQIDHPRLLRTPLAPYVAGNADRFVISPSLQVDYETNAFPFGINGVNTADGVAKDKTQHSNARLSPGVDIALSKPVGRVQVALDSRVGYDFNTATSIYNNIRASVNGSATMQVAGVCAVSAHGTYQQFRLDETELAANISATAREQGYDVSASCNRLSGFAPVLGASYVRETAGALSFFAYRSFSERGGISYAKPSLGTLSLVASFQQFRRPEFAAIANGANGTDVKQINLELSRAVAPHLQMRIGVGYYVADPQRLDLKSTSGPAYDADLRVILSSRANLNLTFQRDLTNDNGTDATYETRDDYSVTGSYKLSGKSNLSLTGEYSTRNLKGEILANGVLPIGSDDLKLVSASYSINLLKSLRLTATVRHYWRTSAQVAYNYQNTALSASIGARF